MRSGRHVPPVEVRARGRSYWIAGSRWQVRVGLVRELAALFLGVVNAATVAVSVKSERGRVSKLIYQRVSWHKLDFRGKVRCDDASTGVEDGMTIRVPNAGDASLLGKGQNGDLLVHVNVASSKLFRRQGTNLYHDVRIPLHTALLGGRVRVPTLDGEVDVRVPSGTQSGEEMVLRGRGIKNVYNSSKGDLFVTFAVQIPRCGR